ncbi:MAG: hypothetical protein P8106_08515 [Gammaproteobacteria bacterium]
MKGAPRIRYRRAEDVQQAFEVVADPAEDEAGGEENPTRVQDFDVDPRGFLFEERKQVEHPDAAHLAVQDLVHRHAAPPVVRRNHDLVDLVAHHVVQQRLLRPDHARLGDDLLAVVQAQVTGDAEGQPLVLEVVDPLRLVARPEHQDLMVAGLASQHPEVHAAQREDTDEREQHRVADHAAAEHQFGNGVEQQAQRRAGQQKGESEAHQQARAEPKAPLIHADCR